MSTLINVLQRKKRLDNTQKYAYTLFTRKDIDAKCNVKKSNSRYFQTTFFQKTSSSFSIPLFVAGVKYDFIEPVENSSLFAFEEGFLQESDLVKKRFRFSPPAYRMAMSLNELIKVPEFRKDLKKRLKLKARYVYRGNKIDFQWCVENNIPLIHTLLEIYYYKFLVKSLESKINNLYTLI